MVNNPNNLKTWTTDIQRKITVITVVLNDAVNLQQTINNVLSQTLENLEYIVIDGGSTDESLEIIKENNFRISKFISQPDLGIYDAMNTGIKMASGDFLHFMNCGDGFISDTVIEELFNSNIDSHIIYGDTKFIYTDTSSRVVKAHPVSEIWKPFFNHQSAFFHKDIFKNTLYNLDFAPAADFHLIMNSISQGYKVKYVPTIVNTYLIGGDIYTKEFKAIRLYYQINLTFNKQVDFKNYYWKKIIWVGFISLFVKKVMPTNLFFKLQRWFRKYKPETSI
ncbi:MAG: glycosyltransferase [Candidatus Marinimicrobia bacterium]|jgi:glycosyltransferase involved in cell wall biosynthesis|nr:glycosyltransferase [Candidatus Neomarinimicrobiota bacterium]MBT3634290.1 glycosyltransferase [Candidatus Neomarinimicrobiota bacterium]MBT3682911.1 glycosyltransferase [Candidatus Neomarinimicrobiota bacterium]MBT3760099.1 glycosyltransferase [Candidatus Neomarinimicrobiota bacterium]MBT3896134.1 glycosyltransferase [Candidatus Neomarinimicrobiota bacterium]